jgi:methylenetetrahydrofolate dehydrogenase (NADP+)/methenyltetrahydrofolate cyclohydrolase
MKPIYSKDIVAARKARLIDAFGAVKQRGITPKLAAVICAADPAAASYVSVKRKHTEEIGGVFEVVDLSTSGAAEAGSRMKALCVRPDVHGVIVVMSSKPEIDEIELTNLIPANKDVDGLSAANLGMLLQNDPPRRKPVSSSPSPKPNSGANKSS